MGHTVRIYFENIPVTKVEFDSTARWVVTCRQKKSADDKLFSLSGENAVTRKVRTVSD